MDNTKFKCPHCGAKLAVLGTTFCGNCGNNVTDYINANPQMIEAAKAQVQVNIANAPAKAKKKKTFIIAGSAIAAVAIILLLVLVIIPNAKNASAYSDAKSYLSKGEYERAKDAFEDLGNYKDSKDMVFECDYQKAMNYADNRDYDDAICILEELSNDNYKDAGEKAKALDTKQKSEFYTKAVESYNRDEYLDAVANFDKAGDYKDAKELALKARMGYVSNHMEVADKTTYEYLTTLVDSDYEGAKKVYDYLYTWTVNCIAVNTQKDSLVDKGKFMNGDNVYFHFEVKGGAPGEKVTIKYSYSLAGEGVSTPTEIGAVMDGSPVTIDTGKARLPEGRSFGILLLAIYDEEGNELGSKSVRVER